MAFTATVFKKVDFPEALEPVMSTPFSVKILFFTGFSNNGWYKFPALIPLLLSNSGMQYFSKEVRKAPIAAIASIYPIIVSIRSMTSLFFRTSDSIELNLIRSRCNAILR